jgi:hypothetical protein
MLSFPRTPKGRIVLALWLVACLAVLIDGFIERNTSEWGMVFFLLMNCLTFPSGYVFSLVFAAVFRFLMANGITVLNERGFIPILILWPFFVVVGYLQWFVLIPWLAHRLTRLFERPTH